MKSLFYVMLAMLITAACNNKNPAESEAHQQMMADLQKMEEDHGRMEDSHRRMREEHENMIGDLRNAVNDDTAPRDSTALNAIELRPCK
ncbi:MAG: hypothetical protein ACK4TA_25380 [Saprospiraceae bacterium]